MSWLQRLGWAALAAVWTAALAGCGTPGAPQPPSLNLPDRVTDLAATRTGNQVRLTWTMPKKNTDKLLLTGDVEVRVCRRVGEGTCEAAGKALQLAPGAAGSFAEMLPPELATGHALVLSYFVELRNRNGRSAGLSNAALVLGGEAPAPVTGLTAEVRKAGVVLRWTPNAADMTIRLQRRLITPPAAEPKQGLLAPQPEPVEQNLLVDAHARTSQALDKSVRFGETYEYRAQRLGLIAYAGSDGSRQTLELAGELSAPVRVEVLDVFPPAVPTGLAAVTTTAEDGGAPSIDLSWQPDTEADLAGYVVYRREGDGPWQRISPAQPVVGPAFHDAHVEAGHTYHYAVSAVDRGGHESARSAEAEETVPKQ
jgi:hypothetical protein